MFKDGTVWGQGGVQRRVTFAEEGWVLWVGWGAFPVTSLPHYHKGERFSTYRKILNKQWWMWCHASGSVLVVDKFPWQTFWGRNVHTSGWLGIGFRKNQRPIIIWESAEIRKGEIELQYSYNREFSHLHFRDVLNKGKRGGSVIGYWVTPRKIVEPFRRQMTRARRYSAVNHQQKTPLAVGGMNMLSFADHKCMLLSIPVNVNVFWFSFLIGMEKNIAWSIWHTTCTESCVNMVFT